jgi:hypothetical protein
MLTWMLASRGTNRLVAFYLAVAFVAAVTVLATYVVVAARHNSAAASSTLELHITQFRSG